MKKNHQYTLRISDESAAEKLLQKLVEKHIKVNKFEILKPTLNDIFIEKVGATNEANLATTENLNNEELGVNNEDND